MNAITAKQNISTQQAKEEVDGHRKTGLQKERLAISSWAQVDSILREMAELQVAINQEIEVFNRRVHKAEDNLYETFCAKRSPQQQLGFKQQVATAAQFLREATERLRARQLYWENMLKKFMTLYYERFVTTEKHCRFGSIHCHGGEVGIILNVDYAKAMLGRP